jgi:hypothetical protein
MILVTVPLPHFFIRVFVCYSSHSSRRLCESAAPESTTNAALKMPSTAPPTAPTAQRSPLLSSAPNTPTASADGGDTRDGSTSSSGQRTPGSTLATRRPDVSASSCVPAPVHAPAKLSPRLFWIVLRSAWARTACVDSRQRRKRRERRNGRRRRAPGARACRCLRPSRGPARRRDSA